MSTDRRTVAEVLAAAARPRRELGRPTEGPVTRHRGAGGRPYKVTHAARCARKFGADGCACERDPERVELLPR